MENPFQSSTEPNPLSRALAQVDKSLTPKMRKELIMKSYHDVVEYAEKLGGKVYSGSGALLKMFPQSESFIVRREDPVRIEELLQNSDPIIIQKDEAVSSNDYANAVEWSSAQGSRGLNTAFNEGFGGSQGFVTVVGIDKASLSSKKAHVPEAQQKIDRGDLLHVQGEVHPKDIRFLLVRMPARFLDEEILTEEEEEAYEDNERLQVFRAIIFPRQNEGVDKKAA